MLFIGILTCFSFAARAERAYAAGAVDVQVDVSGVASAAPGSVATFAVAVANTGTAIANGTAALDLSTANDGAGDANIASVSGTGWSCAPNAASATCTHAGPIAIGASLPTVTVTVTFPTDASVLSLDANLDAFAGEDNVFNNVNSFSTFAISPVDLTVDLDPASINAAVGAHVEFTADVHNIGTDPATGTITANIGMFGGSLGALSVAGPGWTCGAGQFGSTCTRAGPLAGGAHAPLLTIGGTTQAGPSVQIGVNVSHPADGAPGNDTTFASVVLPGPDMQVTLTPQLPFELGAPGTYHAVVTNVGVAATTAPISLSLSGFSAATASGTGWSCTEPSAGFTACTHPGPVAPNAAMPTITYTGTVSDTVVFGNASVSTSGDTNLQNNGDSRSDAVAAADLSIAVTPSTSTAAVGDAVDYTITVKNEGQHATTDSIELGWFSDFGLDVTAVSGSGWTCILGEQSCTHPGPIAAGATMPILTAHATVSTVASTAVAFGVSVFSADEANFENNNASTTITLLGPDLTVAIDDHGATATGAGTVNYDLTVRNLGTRPTTDVISVSYGWSNVGLTVTGSGTGWTCEAFSQVCTHAGPLAAGAALPKLALVATVDFIGEDDITFSAFVSTNGDTNSDNDFVEETTPVAPAIDLVPVVDASGAPKVFQESGTYVVTAHNDGTQPSTGETSLSISSDRGELTIADVTAPGWACSIDTFSVFCTREDAIAAGSSAPAVTVRATLGQFSDTKSHLYVRADNDSDKRSGNNFLDTALDVTSPTDLAVTATDHDATFVAGGPGTYDVTVQNVGTHALAGDATVQIEPGAEIVTVAGAGWDCTPPEFGASSCTHGGPLAPGAAFADIHVTVTAPPADSTYIQATVRSAEDGNIANDYSLDYTDVSALADLVLDLDTTASLFTVGAPVEATATVRNLLPVAADGEVTVNVSGWSDVNDVALSGDGWSCPDALVLSCTHAGPVAGSVSLPPLVITGTQGPTEFGNVTLFASVASAGDGFGQNNNANLTTPVFAPDNLSVSVDGPDAVATGQPATVTATVHNVGTVTDPGPVTVDFSHFFAEIDAVTLAGNGWSCTSQLFEDHCSHPGPLAAGADLPALALTFTPTAAGQVDINANVASATDGLTGNNFASARVDVNATHDLAVGVTAVPPFAFGADGAWDVAVTNPGGLTEASATLTLEPNGAAHDLHATGAGWTCAAFASTLNCTRTEPIVDRTPSVLHVTAALGVSPAGSAQLRASITAPTDTNHANDVADSSVPVSVPVDFALGITAPTQVNAGSAGSITIAVHNVGSAASTMPVTVLVNQPFGTTAIGTGAGWDCAETDQFRCTHAGGIAAGATVPITIVGTFAATDSGSGQVRATSVSAEDGISNNDSAQQFITVITVVDLAVGLDAAATATAGIATSATVLVQNVGHIASSGAVAVTIDGLSTAEDVTASGPGWTCADPTADAITCSRADALADGAAFPDLTVAFVPTADAIPNLTLHARAASDLDGVTGNNEATKVVGVTVGADLAVTAAPAAPEVLLHNDLHETITVSNASDARAYGPIQLHVGAGGGLGALAISGSGWDCTTDAFNATCTRTGRFAPHAALPALTLTAATIALGAGTLDVSLTGAAETTTDNNTAHVAATIRPKVDLIVAVDATDPPYTTAQTESATVTVRNLGLEAAPGPVTLTLTQDAGGLPNYDAGNGWECLTLFGTTSCTHPGPVPASGSLPPLTGSFEVLVGDYPQYFVDATVEAADDVVADNNTTSARIAVLGVDLGIKVTDLGAPDPATIGQRRSYEIAVDNHGGLAPPGAVTVTLSPERGLVTPLTTGAGWECTPDDAVITCTSTQPVPARGSYPVLGYSAHVGGAAYPMVNLVAAVAAPGEAQPIDNNDLVTTEVTGAPDLVVAAEWSAPAYDVGTTATATVVVRNQGSLPTNGLIDLTGPMPRGLTLLDVTGVDDDGVWVCTSADDSWGCSHPGPVAAGASLPSVRLRFTVGVDAYPRSGLQAAVDNISDEDPNNNHVTSAAFDVTGIADLSVDTTRGEAVAGEVFTAAATVRNIGTVAADRPSDIVVNTYSTGLAPISAAGDGWTCSPVTGGFHCRTEAHVPAHGTLPPITLTARVSDTTFDWGQDCHFADVGRGLERVCRDVGFRPAPGGVDIEGVLSNDSDPRFPVQSFGIGQFVTERRDAGVRAGAATQFYMGERASFVINPTNYGIDSITGLVVVRARFDCGHASGDSDNPLPPNGNCDPGLRELGVLGPLEVVGEGWTCGVDALDAMALTCTRSGLPSGPAEPITVSAEMDPTFRGVFVIRSSITAPGDGNPFNDRASDAINAFRRPVTGPTTSDLTPYVRAPRTIEYTVGVNDLMHPTVFNIGPNATSGTVTMTVALGAGTTFLRDEPDDWACAAVAKVVTCTSDTPIAPADPDLGGGFASAAFVVGIDAAGPPVSTHSITVSYANDPIDSNNTREQTDAVFDGPVPTAVLGASETVVPTPSTISFDASLSQNTRPNSVYRWDFGDGTTGFGETIDHAYTRHGVFTATLRVFNGARFGTDKQRIIAYPDEPLVADAGEDRVVEEASTVTFDGGASRPALGIQSYRWDFGDGTVATGRTVPHVFTAPGTYAVALTVRIGVVNVTDTIAVTVVAPGDPGDPGGLVVQVNDPNGAPIRLADVAVYDRNGRRFGARADTQGRASLRGVPNGPYTAYAYKIGFLPGVGQARVVGGAGVGTVVLKPGAVGDATLEHHRMTIAEIVAAGIDTTDPANRNVIEFDLTASFEVFGEPLPDAVDYSGFGINADGVILFAPEGWDCDPDVCSYDSPGGGTVIIDGEDDPEAGPVVTTLIIPGKASFLKEFFEITMMVSNLGGKGFAFIDGAATLDLPAGLSLAPTAAAQSLTTEMAPIKSGTTGAARWIVRGDKAGEYDLGAAYSAVLDPVGSSILLTAQTREPLKVWGADAAIVRARAQAEVRKGKPYRVRIGLENVSDAPIYNAGFDFDELLGGGRFVYAPWSDRHPTIDVIQPATTWWVELWLIPDFDGELIACNLCEDGPGPARAGRAHALAPSVAAAAAADPVTIDTAIFAPFVKAAASGDPRGIDPKTVVIENVADDYPAFTATAAVGIDHLSWTPAAGATAQRVYLDSGTGFGAEPVAVLDGAVHTLDLPSAAGAHSYLLGSVVDGTEQLVHAIATIVPGAGEDPTGVADSAFTEPGVPVVIDVLANDADLDGGALTIVDASDPAHGAVECGADGTCTYTPDAGFEGTDSFVVTISDGAGGTTTQTVTVVVGAAGTNRPPHAVADTAMTNPGTPVEIPVLANDSDPDSDPLQVTGVGGPAAADVECAGDGTCTYTPPAGFTGAALFTYSVDDGHGGTASAAVRVVVVASAPVNQPPTASFTATANGAEVAFDGHGSSDADGSVAGYLWSFGDGSSGAGIAPTHTYDTSGTYSVTLSVIDDLGAKGSVRQQIEAVVAAPNAPPIAAFGATTDGLAVSFDGALSTDTDGTVTGYLWDFGDESGESATAPDHTYAAAGTYAVTLTVVDDDGAHDSVTQRVVVAPGLKNESPVASFTSTPHGADLAFDAGATSDDGTVASYHWDFGDGAEGSGAHPDHTYAAPGKYLVVLVVTDDTGATARFVTAIVIADTTTSTTTTTTVPDTTTTTTSTSTSTTTTTVPESTTTSSSPTSTSTSTSTSTTTIPGATTTTTAPDTTTTTTSTTVPDTTTTTTTVPESTTTTSTVPETTTSTASTSTTIAASTTTSSTTTVPPSSTTSTTIAATGSTASSSTTTLPAGTAPTTAPAAGAGSTGGGGTSGPLPRTGAGSAGEAFAGLLLVLIGLIGTVLLRRRPDLRLHPPTPAGRRRLRALLGKFLIGMLVVAVLAVPLVAASAAPHLPVPKAAPTAAALGCGGVTDASVLGPRSVNKPLTDFPNMQAVCKAKWIPGVDEGFTPQGVELVGDGSYIVSGYNCHVGGNDPCSKDSAADWGCRTYRVWLDATPSAKLLELKPDVCGHAGGIAVVTFPDTIAPCPRQGPPDPNASPTYTVISDTKNLLFFQGANLAATIPLGKSANEAEALQGSFVRPASGGIWIGTWKKDHETAFASLIPFAKLQQPATAVVGGKTVCPELGVADASKKVELRPDVQGALFQPPSTWWVSQSTSKCGLMTDMESGVEYSFLPGSEEIEPIGGGRFVTVSEAGTAQFANGTNFTPMLVEFDPATLDPSVERQDNCTIPENPPVPAPGEDLIAYVCIVDGASQICTIKSDGSDKRQLTVAGGVFSPTWSPDGTQIAFTRGGLVVDGQNRIYVMDADGSNEHLIGSGSEPDWGPGESDARYEVDGRGSDAPDPATSYRWSYGDKTGAVGRRQQHAYASEGYFTATLTLEDSSGLTSEATSTLSNPSVGRSPTVEFTASALDATHPLTAHLDASASHDDSAITSWHWQFGDGDGDSGTGTPVVDHPYDSAGLYLARLTLYDDQGLAASVRRWIAVGRNFAHPPPIARFTTALSGSRIAFVKSNVDPEDNRRTDAWTMNTDGSDPRPATFGAGSQEDPAWTPDGQNLVVGLRRTISSEKNNSDLYSIPVSAPEQFKNLTAPQYKQGQSIGEIGPDVSPDGTQVAYADCTPFGTQGKCQFDTTRIVVADLTATGIANASPLVQPSPDGFQFDPAWSPDGARIAYANVAKGLMLMDRDGEHLDQIPNTGRHDRAPAFRPPHAVASVQSLLTVDASGEPTFSFARDEPVYALVPKAKTAVTVCRNPFNSGSTCAIALPATPTSLGMQPLGRYTLHATINGIDVASQPFTVTCQGRCVPPKEPLPTQDFKARAAQIFNMRDMCPLLAITTTAVIGTVGASLALIAGASTFALGVAVVAALATVADVPFFSSFTDLFPATLDAFCKFNILKAQKIMADPPSADYQTVARPDFSAVDHDASSPGKALREAWQELGALQDANLAALERAQGAHAAGDAVAEARQMDALLEFGSATAEASSRAADALGEIQQALPSTPATAQPPFTAEQLAILRAGQDRVAQHGLTQAERDRLAAGGHTPAEIDAAEAAFVAHDLPDTLATTSITQALQTLQSGYQAYADDYAGLMRKLENARLSVLPSPMTRSQQIEVARDSSVGIDLDAVDPENAPIDFAIATPPTHGTVKLDGGHVLYTPTAGYLGPDSFTWVATNDAATSPETIVSISVLEPPPAAHSDEYGTVAGTTLKVPAPGVLTNDIADSLPVTVELGTRPANGALGLLADGSFSYTPRAGFSGTDSFTYKARTPGSAASAAASVTIKVVDANRAPTAVSDVLVVDEDHPGTVDVLANDSDADHDPLTFTGVTQPQHGNVVCVVSQCTYAPALDFNGTDGFSYTVSDGQGSTTSGFVAVTVNPVGDAPRPADDLIVIEPGLPGTIAVLANDTDPDGDAVSFVSHGDPAHGTASCDTVGVCVYTPADDAVSADAFAYTVRDADGHQATATVTITTDVPLIESAGPLELIATGNTLSCSVNYKGDTLGSFFNDVGCGTFLATGGTLYGQSFTGVGLNPPQPRDTYEPLSQTRTQGSGTLADPFRVVTRVRAGTSGLELTQTDTYVVGEESYRTDIRVLNTGAGAADAIVYRAGDCQLGDSDTGLGRLDAGSGAVTCLRADGRILEWEPITAGARAIETDPDTLWDAIASQQPFPGTCRCQDDIDNAGGISWSVTVPAGGSTVLSHRTVFSPFGYRPLPSSLTADAPRSATGTANGYELRVTNPNPTTPVELDSLRIALPAGFSYTPHSTTGVTAHEPTGAGGAALTWTGPFTVPAGGSVTLHVGVRVADVSGVFRAGGGGSSADLTVLPVDDAAPIEVFATYAPRAAASATTPALTATFDGSTSFDPDGTIAGYAWDFGDGTNGTGAQPVHTYAPGSYTATLTVTDNDGASGSATVAVVARPPNVLPVASFTGVVTGLDVQFDARASTDPDGDIVSYIWDFGDGDEGSGPAPAHTYSAPGSYSVALTVTDDRGGTAASTKPIVIAPLVNAAPVASFTVDPNGFVVGFDGSGSFDPDGTVVAYAWKFGDLAPGTGVAPSHTYAAPGTYAVELTVTDAAGKTASATRSVVVAADRTENAKPVARFAADTTALAVTFDAATSFDSDGEIVDYAWDFGNGDGAEGQRAVHTFDGPGTYPVELLVVDNDGAAATMRAEIEVRGDDLPPVAAFTSSQNELVTSFDASGSSDPDGLVVAYDWDFGDGQHDTGVAPIHGYSAPGDYDVTLTVTDDRGLSDSVTHPVQAIQPATTTTSTSTSTTTTTTEPPTSTTSTSTSTTTTEPPTSTTTSTSTSTTTTEPPTSTTSTSTTSTSTTSTSTSTTSTSTSTTSTSTSTTSTSTSTTSTSTSTTSTTVPPSTTTSTSTTSTTEPTTSTTEPPTTSTTSTTAPPTTTTTIGPLGSTSTTTTTVGATATGTTSTTAAATVGGTGTGDGSGGGELVFTGSSATRELVVAIFVLMFGFAFVLFSRRRPRA